MSDFSKRFTLSILCLCLGSAPALCESGNDLLSALVDAEFGNGLTRQVWKFDRVVKGTERIPLSDADSALLRTRYIEELTTKYAEKFNAETIAKKADVLVDLARAEKLAPGSYNVSGEVVAEFVNPGRWRVTSMQPFINSSDAFCKEVAVSNGRGLLVKTTQSVDGKGVILPPSNIFRIVESSKIPILDLAPWLPTFWLSEHVLSADRSWRVEADNKVSELKLFGSDGISESEGVVKFNPTNYRIEHVSVVWNLPSGEKISRVWTRDEEGWTFKSVLGGEEDEFKARLILSESISSKDIELVFPHDALVTLAVGDKEIDLPISDVRNKSFDEIRFEQD